MSSTTDVIKWGSVGLGCYWLWQYFNGGTGLSLSSLTGSLTPPSSAATTTAAPLPTAVLNTSTNSGSDNLVTTWAAASGGYTTPAWDAFLAAHGLTVNSSQTVAQWAALKAAFQATTAGPATTTPATTAAPSVPTIGKYAYTNKSTYLAALINAVADAGGGASGTQTADGWNYLMVNTVGVNLAPAPDSIMSALGLDRNATVTASAYYNGMDAAGLLPYPSGLSGLGLGSARLIAVPRVLVARLANGKTVMVRA